MSNICHSISIGVAGFQKDNLSGELPVTLVGSKPRSSTTGWKLNNEMERDPRPKTWKNWSLIPIELRGGAESVKMRRAPVGMGEGENIRNINWKHCKIHKKRENMDCVRTKGSAKKKSYRILQSLPRTERASEHEMYVGTDILSSLPFFSLFPASTRLFL